MSEFARVVMNGVLSVGCLFNRGERDGRGCSSSCRCLVDFDYHIA